MRRHEESGGPSWWGPPAGTNGPGRLDERRYDQNASFMTNFSPASCPFTIGSAFLRKNTKKTQSANLGGIQITCGTLLHKRPLIDADPLETERRAEYDRRADYARRVEIARADYDRRVEMARRDEYDRRMEYDLSVLCQRKMSTAEDFELQVRRLDEMGKIIDTLTTMLTKPPQPQGAATEEIALMPLVAGVAGYSKRAGYVDLTGYKPEPVKTGLGFARASEDVLEVRQIVKICRRGTAFHRAHREPGKHREEANEDFGFHRAQEAELKVRKILKLCRKTDEEGLVDTLLVADNLAHAPREATRGAKVLAAGEYWKEGSTTQVTSGASNDKERHNNRQIRTSARDLRTSDPKLRTKIKYNNNGGKTEGVDDDRGVMSLKICMYSTRREKMKLGTLATKRASKQGQKIRLSARRMKANNECKDWWKRLSTSKKKLEKEKSKGIDGCVPPQEDHRTRN